MTHRHNINAEVAYVELLHVAKDSNGFVVELQVVHKEHTDKKKNIILTFPINYSNKQNTSENITSEDTPIQERINDNTQHGTADAVTITKITSTGNECRDNAAVGEELVFPTNPSISPIITSAKNTSLHEEYTAGSNKLQSKTKKQTTSSPNKKSHPKQKDKKQPPKNPRNSDQNQEEGEPTKKKSRVPVRSPCSPLKHFFFENQIKATKAMVHVDHYGKISYKY